MKKKIEVLKQCIHCGQPALYIKDNVKTCSGMNHNGIYYCHSCYFLYHWFSLEQSYQIDGINFGISEITRIKIRIYHQGLDSECEKNRFCVYIYADVRYKRKSNSTGIGGSPYEFSFKINFDDFYFRFNDITREIVKNSFAKNLNRVKVPERKILSTNEKFITYVYDRMKQVAIKLDKTLVYYFGM